MTLLPYNDERHLRASQFLVEEANLLDRARFDDWLALLHADIVYRMPVRVTTMRSIGEEAVQTMDHFLEDHYSLSKRVERFATDHAWTEDPLSRTRHHVSNIRSFAVDEDGDGSIRVESALLLYRSRGDLNEPSVLSAGRSDLLVDSDRGLLLKERLIEVDEAVLRTQNLAVFL